MKVEKILNEMAYTRPEAMERCASLGKKFIEHFNKIYNNSKSKDLNHWCAEMQAWFDSMDDIKLKSTKKALTRAKRNDWFYSFGSTWESFFNDDEAESSKYEEFIDALEKSKDVYISIKEVFNINEKS